MPDCGGRFSKTSNDIQFSYVGKLKALCKARATRECWVPSVLDLNFHLENRDGIVQSALQKPGLFLESCSDVKLLGTKLSGTAKRRYPGMDAIRFELDLDRHVENIDGRLVWLDNLGERGGLFSKTSKDIKFTYLGQRVLQARCQTSTNEWVPSMLDLNFYLANIDGQLQFATERPGRFLDSTQNVMLKGTKLGGTAERKSSRSDIVRFELDLDNNVANIEGHLVWLLKPSQPYDSPDNDEGGLGSYDASGNPEIYEYAKSEQPKRSKREATITPATKKDKQDIQNLVRLWDQNLMDRGLRQSTLVTFPQRSRPGEYTPHREGWRIDNQENGSFPVGDLQYYSLAVQIGSAVYASVLVPVGYNVGATRIRNAFNRSMDEGRVIRIAPPPPAAQGRPLPAQDDPGVAAAWVRGLQWVALGALIVMCV